MFAYYVTGNGYNKIMVDVKSNLDYYSTTQYYMIGDSVIKSSSVIFDIDYSDGVVLRGIKTDDDDTVVLPRGIFDAIDSYAMEGCRFRRFIIPAKTNIVLKNKSLFGNSNLETYISLSRDVNYEGSIFPPTVKKRYV